MQMTKGEMTKLMRQQFAQEIEIDVFTENPLDLNYLMAVFDEAVEQKT